MRILHPDNATSGFVSVTIWCFWVFARRQLLKITDVSGRIVGPIIRLQDTHVVWLNK